jgi:hypothetical protein
VPGERFEENADHEVEYRADSAGFGLFRTALGIPVDPPELLLAPITLAFLTFYRLAGGASSSHPHPFDRIVRIAADHYGKEVAATMREAFLDSSLWPKVFGGSR